MTIGNRLDFPAKRIWAIFFAVIALSLVAGGYGFYRMEAKHIRLDKYNELAAIGELKAGQIAQWRQERLDDVLEDAESPFFVKGVEAWLKDSGNVVLRDEFLQRLKLEQRTEDVADALLLDVDGRILLAAKDDPEPVDAATMKAVAEALASKQAALSDLFRSPDGHVCIDAVAPVRDADNQPIAVVVLRSDAAKFLYPLIQSWPIPSRSAETVLVRKEGGDVLFLSDLRYRAGAALSLRIPLTSRDTPAVQAVAGKQGIFVGRDYRGVKVLADLRQVPGSAWFMVAKVNSSEILAELHYRAGAIAVLVLLFVLLSAFVAAFLYRQRQVRLYRDLYASERGKQKAEELLRATLIGIGDAVIAADERGCVTFMNPVAETLTGWPDAEAQGKPLSQVFHIVNAETRERCENPVEKVLARGRVVGLANHTLLIARDGTERRIADSGAPIRDVGGSVIGVVLVFRDVTEEYRMQEALRQSEALYRSLVAHIPQCILRKDLEGRFTFADESFCRLLGKSQEEILGKTDFDFYPSGLAEKYRNDDRHVVETLVEFQTDEENILPTGEILYVRVIKVPIKDASGEAVGIQCIFEDITERKRAEEALRESEARYRELFDNISSGVAIYEARDNGNDFVFKDFNKAGERLDGDRREDLVGKSIHEVRPGIEEFGLLDVFRRVWKTGIPERFPAKIYQDERLSGWYENFVYRLPTGEIVAVFDDVTERKRAEEALRESEEKFRSLFDRTPDGVYRSTPAGRYLDVNAAMVKMYGYDTREEMLALDIPRDIYFSREEREARLREALQGKISVFRQRRKDGAEIWVEGYGYDLRDEQGNVLIHQGILRDVTDRKRADEALRESEERFRSLFERVPDGIYRSTHAGRFMDVNPAMVKMFGYDSREEMLALDIPKDLYFAPEDRDEELLDTGQGKISVFRQRRKDGSEIWVEDHGRYVYDEHGNVLFHEGILRDVTESKRAEETLRESEEKFRHLFNNAEVGMFRSRLDGSEFLDMNDKYLSILGTTREESLGKPSEILWADPKEREEMVKTLQAQGHVDDLECRLLNKAGEVRHCLSSVRLYPETGILEGSVMDITERKRAEEEKEKMQAQLTQALKMESVGRLAGGVAHDFNNMLSVILGHAELALQGLQPTDALYDDLREIAAAGKRSADLTRQLLAFARKQTIAPKVLDLNDTVAGMLKMLRRLVGEDIDMLWKPASNLWPVKLDAAQVNQVLVNLLVNARDAIEDVGKVAIETENAAFDEAYCADHAGSVPGEYVMLAVSDSGRGMDRETLSRIFEPFFTTKGVGEGTGLGLATVYGIVKQNTGFINVYSEPGKGTTLKIYIPRHQSGGAVAGKTAVSAEVPTGTETVLLVEDEEALLTLGAKLLEQLGYKVLAANGPNQALQLAEEYEDPIHLLMTDVVMPEMNGQDLRQRLISRRPGLKCLFMSGYTANVITHHGILEEGILFLQKPFSRQALAAKLREALGNG